MCERRILGEEAGRGCCCLELVYFSMPSRLISHGSISHLSD